MVGGPRRVLDRYVPSTALSDDLAVEGLRRPARIDVIDSLPGWPVGDPGVASGIGMDLPIRVPQPDAEKRLAHRPRNGAVDSLVHPGGPARVVETRRLVQIAGQEQRI